MIISHRMAAYLAAEQAIRKVYADGADREAVIEEIQHAMDFLWQDMPGEEHDFLDRRDDEHESLVVTQKTEDKHLALVNAALEAVVAARLSAIRLKMRGENLREAQVYMEAAERTADREAKGTFNE